MEEVEAGGSGEFKAILGSTESLFQNKNDSKKGQVEILAQKFQTKKKLQVFRALVQSFGSEGSLVSFSPLSTWTRCLKYLSSHTPDTMALGVDRMVHYLLILRKENMFCLLVLLSWRHPQHSSWEGTDVHGILE